MNFTMLNIEEKTQAVVAALEDVKGQDIQVIDTSKLSSLFERMVIASAQSTRQTKALADHVEEQLKALGVSVLGVEGGALRWWTTLPGKLLKIQMYRLKASLMA